MISKFSKGFWFLLSITDIYSKYAWVVPLKDKKDITITNAFQKPLNESSHKPNKIWVDKGSEFCNKSMKTRLQDNNIEMHSTYNKEKSLVAEIFIRTFDNKIYKCMTSASKNVYIDIVDVMDIKYSNTYHRTIKMKPVDVRFGIYTNFGKNIIIKTLDLMLATI